MTDVEKAAHLSQLEYTLQKPDAVMEPDILNTVLRYVQHNGNPELLVQYLTEGYIGYAQMASLACGWLDMIDKGSAGTQKDQQTSHVGMIANAKERIDGKRCSTATPEPYPESIPEGHGRYTMNTKNERDKVTPEMIPARTGDAVGSALPPSHSVMQPAQVHRAAIGDVTYPDGPNTAIAHSKNGADDEHSDAGREGGMYEEEDDDGGIEVKKKAQGKFFKTDTKTAMTTAATTHNATYQKSRNKQRIAYNGRRLYDEAYFLRSLVLDRFDPEKFSRIFAAGGSGAPKWLNSLVSYHEGRLLIYDLASRYENNILLNFAIAKILKDPGRDEELASSLDSSFVGFFGVYHKILGARLRRIVRTKSRTELEILCNELLQSAQKSQHAYVHVQQMLRFLASTSSLSILSATTNNKHCGNDDGDGAGLQVSTENGNNINGEVDLQNDRGEEMVMDGYKKRKKRSENAALHGTAHATAGVVVDDDKCTRVPQWAPRFKRLAQEIEEAIDTPTVWKMHRWFGPAGEVAALCSAYISDILVGASSGTLPPSSDVIKLHRMYCNNSSGGELHGGGGIASPTAPSARSLESSRPSISLLREPRLIQVLLRGIFTPGKQLKSDVQTAHIDLVALAVAGLDDADVASGVALGDSYCKQVHDTQQASDEASAASQSASMMQQPAVITARTALEISATLCHKALADEILAAEEKEKASVAMKEPCCALGLLGMLRARLTSHEYWATTYHLHKVPPFLYPLMCIVTSHPSLHGDVMSLIVDAISTAGNTGKGLDVIKGLLKVMAALLAAGRVEQVMSWAEQWSKNADSEVIRAFVFAVLERAGPPYSFDFARQMLRLMQMGGVRRQKMGNREWNAKQGMLVEFVRACQEMHFDAAKHRTESACMKELVLALKAILAGAS